MKKLTLLLLLLLTTTLSFSQVSIGNGNDGDGINSPPISPYYGFSYSQSIYLASEISASGDITSIEYALNAGSNFSSADDSVDVWIGHTSKTVFDSTSDWVDVSTLSHVLIDGTVTVANDVLTLTFSSSFTYNGTDNIVIAIDANESGYNTSSDYVLSTNGPTAGLTLDQRSDTTNSDPTSPALGTLRQNRGNITFNGITQSCPSPTSLTVTSVSSTGATISWIAGGSETAWEYVVQPDGTGEPTTAGASATSPHTETGLTANTAYEVYVRANCGGGDYSSWESITFTTDCEIFTAPYSQDFENSGDIPDCWNMSGDEPWIFANTTTGGHVGNAGSVGNSSASGGYFAYVDDSSPDSSGTTLQTPAVDVSSLTTPVLAFYLLSNNEGYSNVNFSVDIYDGGAWNVGVYTSNTNTADWEEKIVDLTGLTITGPIKARFIVDEVTSSDFYDDVAIDDVRIMEMPTCSKPTEVTLDAVTETTATISWTLGGSETAWEYVVQPDGTGEPTTAGASATNPLTETGLTANTPYEVYVRANCGGGDYSEWVRFSFLTEANCDTATAAFSHDFQELSGSTVLEARCWNVTNGGDSNTWTLVTDAEDNVFWSLLYSSTAAHDDYLYSPSFTVLDGVTDGFNFKGWSTSSIYVESIDLLVVNPSDNTVLGTLQSNLELPYVASATSATKFTYDLSSYEGQDVKIGFYSSTLDLLYARLDEFTLDAYATLGTENNVLEGFTLYPTIVIEELNFRSQKNVDAISVYNLLGQEVFTGKPNANSSSINLSSLRPGIYMVRVTAEGLIGTYKIIKE